MHVDRKVKVLIVDDSALVRALLQEVLTSSDRLEVCGCAADPYEARDMIKKLNPDVLTLDIEMPKMNGIAFLKNLMRLRPMPVVMISTLTQEGAPATLQALELGAVDFMPKPKNHGVEGLAYYQEEICEKVYAAARANIRQFSNIATKSMKKEAYGGGKLGRLGYICAIGASTGGTEAIKAIVSSLPENCPPIVVTQHIPESFSLSFAKRVDALSVPTVAEAQHNQTILPGHVYISPGHSHLTVKRVGSSLQCQLDKRDRVNRHRPSVEVLFDSVASEFGAQCMAVILTGMGADGAEALLRLREKGAKTIAQDEASSVVWGMPGAAVKLGAAEKVMDIERISRAIMADYFKK